MPTGSRPTTSSTPIFAKGVLSGSGDRRFIAEKIWHIIRRRRRLTFEAGSADPRKLLIAYLKDEDPAEIFAGGEYGLPPLNDDERKLAAALRTEERTYPPAVECECPDWLFAKIGDPLLLKALNEPAGADFRVCRGSREEVLRLLENEGFEAVPTPVFAARHQAADPHQP